VNYFRNIGADLAMYLRNETGERLSQPLTRERGKVRDFWKETGLKKHSDV